MGNVLIEYDVNRPLDALCPNEESKKIIRRELFESEDWLEGDRGNITDAEMLAMRWHMGAWGVNMTSFEDMRNYDAAKTLYPLVSIVQAGDSLAASILERKGADLDEL